MRIVVVGAGATGGYFGGKLAQAGRDVTFLVRERRAAVLRDRGLRLVSPDGTDVSTPSVVTAAELAGGTGRPADTVLVTVKAAGLAAAIEEFRPAVGPDTTVVPVLNGMRHMTMLNAGFGPDRVLGGVAVISAQLNGDGDVMLLGGGGASLTIGAQDGPPTPGVQRTQELLGGAGFPVTVSATITAAMWGKWAFIASVGAATCLLGGTAGEITAAGGVASAQLVTAEAYQVAAAAGYPAPDAARERTVGMLTQPGSPFASSMYRDLRQGRPVEVDTILGDLVEQARKSGVPTPLLDAASVALRIHNARLAA
jgi:2-dehydropantoate 2-reductase